MMRHIKVAVKSPDIPVSHPALSRCPVCDGELRIARLQCIACGSALEGSFTFGRFGRLTREQVQFAEVFIKSRGKIKDVEDELGVSYPTVIARLNDLVLAMGYEAPPDDAAAGRRQTILDDLANGTISAAEAASRLRAI